ncbi:FAD-dependent oxidoreductase [Nonomuraea sp. NPDC050783]|uniref:FAD-dependent oxidoreductase n=1 Tax=Nonomuraea sp. NPDC050783 TaxID=3154634 RepID=UPI003466DA18
MRACVIGGGLAGTLLAWRLKAAAPEAEVCLYTGGPPPGPSPERAARPADATAASGGLVRGFEPDPAAARLAAESLAELRASPVLCDWADYREIGSVHVCAAPPDPASVPPSAEVVAGPGLAALGIRGVPDGASAVVERHAGHIAPHRLRVLALRDFRRRGGETVTTPVERVGPGVGLDVGLDVGPGGGLDVGPGVGPGGAVVCVAGGVRRRFDLAVVAAGAWTPGLLARSGLAGPALWTKRIQYQIYEVSGRRPPAFVDETTGLYGRPYGRSAMLLGVPSQARDVDPGAVPRCPRGRRDTEAAARERLPGLRLLRLARTVTACDAYAGTGLLGLAGLGPGLHTFTGGSGGAAKLALAASARAARHLLAASLPPLDAPRRTEPQ